MSNTKDYARIQDLVQIGQSGLRSINVENDLDNDAIARSYVLTGQARASLARILNAFERVTPTRSWTLTGPYGSGKSFFSLFLMNLMGKAQPGHARVFAQLQEVDAPLAERVRASLNHGSTKGLLPIPVTGYRAPLQECLRHGFIQALERLNANGQVAPLLAEARGWSNQTESRVIIRWLASLLEILTQPDFGFAGAMLIFDEMGKPLEFAASHPQETDIYLLQELAEFANRSGDKPLVLIGILHQAFEQYAHLLDKKTQQEWSKVQGRFEDVTFQEPANQQVRLLARAIEYADEARLGEVKTYLEQVARAAAEHGWCPPMMKADEFVALAAQAYPLHPTALAALPFVFRRLAQNERSIFAYLSSHEPRGFQEFIADNPLGALIGLPQLFDYLAANFQGRLYATGRARAITETIEKLENLTNLGEVESALLKTIGMLNWLSEVSALQASEDSILNALRSPAWNDETLRGGLKKLQLRSLVVYRRFNKTYTIWQGSDVDIEERLQQAQQRVSTSFSLADAVQKYLPPRPIAARRHSYQTGTLRYFEVRYVDSFLRATVDLTPTPGASGKVLLCLPANYAELQEFTAWAQSEAMRAYPNIVIGIAERTGRLPELQYELNCLHWVEENTPELRDDPVAKRELRARLSEIETLVKNEIDQMISPYHLSQAGGCRWFYRGEPVQTRPNQGLSHLISGICDQLYAQSPVVWNEIVNRRQLSSQGAAARRNLIEGMLTRADQERLGIEGFPPERSAYDAILKASGLHREIAPGKWALRSLPESDPLRLRPVWQAMEDFIFGGNPEPRSVAALYQILGAAPYGVTDGVVPILFCAFMIANQGEVTLYQEGTLLPEPSIAHWEVLLRRPDLYAVAGCKVTGTRLAIVERFARAYRVEAQTMPVVRSLIRGIKSLPEHTLRTNRLSERTRAVRQAIEQARSPEQLLFSDLPKAVGMASFEHRDLAPEQVETFFERLNAAMTELASEMTRLLKWGRDELLMACGLETGEVGWGVFRALASDLSGRPVQPNLLPLLKRAAETNDPLAALESTLAYVANRPPRTWTDTDADRFVGQAKVLGELFQAEQRGVLSDAGLTPEQRRRSREIADALREQLDRHYGDDPQALKAALQLLIQAYSVRQT
ncbi:MAG: hypothetical protein WHV44_01360 [Anaerolineales bacterium]